MPAVSPRTRWGDEGKEQEIVARMIDGRRAGPLDAVHAADNVAVDVDDDEEAKSTADVSI